MGDAWLQFQTRYYMFALVFVVFDVEIIFLYPWAMSFDVLGDHDLTLIVMDWYHLVQLYEQMPEPKYFIAMGACTITGGMFSTDSYSTVRGVDKLILVDVYLSGCPPKSEVVIDAITKLHKKISREIYEDQFSYQRENRCFTTNHKFYVGRDTHTGNYNQGLFYQPSSISEITSDTFLKYKKVQYPPTNEKLN
ncbi:hypothetical protein RYX36_018274 [Vicia faba]